MKVIYYSILFVISFLTSCSSVNLFDDESSKLVQSPNNNNNQLVINDSTEEANHESDFIDSQVQDEDECNSAIGGGIILFSSQNVGNYSQTIYLYCQDSDALKLSGDIEVNYFIGYSKLKNSIIFTGKDDFLYEADLYGKEIERVFNYPVDEMYLYNLSPDGSRILNFNEHTISVVDILSGESQLLSSDFMPMYPEWTPDGENILFSDYYNGELYLLALTLNDSEIYPEVMISSGILYPKISPDGIYVAYSYHFMSSGQYGVYLVDLEKKTVQLTEFPGRYVEWSPNCQDIAYSFRDEDTHYLMIGNVLDGDFYPISDGYLFIDGISWSPDSEFILFNAGQSLYSHGYLYMVPSDGSGESVRISGHYADVKEFYWVDVSIND